MGNKGFGDMLADSAALAGAPKARVVLPTDSVLETRSQVLGQLAAGKLVTETVKWVDARRCRPWLHHNRDQGLLTEESCQDLIASFLSEKRQRLPAIVRRIQGDPDHDYEIIAGVRRHWTVLWLNQHNHPDFEFLINVQQLTDEEAFRLADVENRARRDLTDLERARDYLKALTLFYGGRQNNMAERLRVQPAWLSRLLDLARMPETILAAFGDQRLLKVEHAKQLAPSLREPEALERVLEAAGRIAARQQAAMHDGRPALKPVDVVRELQRAAASRPAARARAQTMVMSRDMRPMLRSERKRNGAILIELLPGSGASRKDLKEAVARLLDTLSSDQPLG